MIHNNSYSYVTANLNVNKGDQGFDKQFPTYKKNWGDTRGPYYLSHPRLRASH